MDIDFHLLESIALGLGLGIAAGFRAFVPFLVLSIASVFGPLSLTDSLSWLDNSQVLIGLIVAVIFEILSYSIPWLDNITDVLAVPLAGIAGTILMLGTTGQLDPFSQWGLAILAGGGSAITVKGLAGLTRFFSTATTGGLANFFIAIGELIAAVGMTILTLTLPIVGVIAIAIFLIILTIIWFKYKNKKPLSPEVIS
jgi:hypothetical protein